MKEVCKISCTCVPSIMSYTFSPIGALNNRIEDDELLHELEGLMTQETGTDINIAPCCITLYVKVDGRSTNLHYGIFLLMFTFRGDREGNWS